MAIDTRAKRDSALLDLWGLPIPDGTLDEFDRGWMVGQYSGIASEAASPLTATEAATLPARSVAATLSRRSVAATLPQ